MDFDARTAWDLHYSQLNEVVEERVCYEQFNEHFKRHMKLLRKKELEQNPQDGSGTLI